MYDGDSSIYQTKEIHCVFLCDDPSVNFVALSVAGIDITTLHFILNRSVSGNQ